VSWADLEKLAMAKPRADGTQTLVIRDDRPRDRIVDAKHLSTLVAIARVIGGRYALAEKLGGRGSVVYMTAGSPPEFLVEAVTAAGGSVFDGVRTHTASSPLATTVQLDAAFFDLASVVRRRLDARSFSAALEVLEFTIRRAPPARTNVEAWWTAILELVALTGEVVREKRAAKWIEVPSQRLPFGLDLGKGEVIHPGKLAHTILEGGAGSMSMLLEIATPSTTGTTPMALLSHRRSVPIEKLTWEPLISADLDTEHVPVIVYVEDRGGVIEWPFGSTTPTPERRATALANLAKERFTIEAHPISEEHRLVTVSGELYGAESLLVPATMNAVRAELGNPSVLFVAVPARGWLLAIDGERAQLDEDLKASFLVVVEKEYLHATERDRISSTVILYTDRPAGLVA
jgi:hypothetical protein